MIDSIQDNFRDQPQGKSREAKSEDGAGLSLFVRVRL